MLLALRLLALRLLALCLLVLRLLALRLLALVLCFNRRAGGHPAELRLWMSGGSSPSLLVYLC